jgi:hypothetical protein
MKRKKEKGLEFGWTHINETDIRLLFAAVMGAAPAKFGPQETGDLETRVGQILSGGQGFGLNSQERKAIEARSMEAAIAHYKKAGTTSKTYRRHVLMT